MKKKFNMFLCVNEIKYRLEIYQKLLSYYNSRIEENKKYNLKPWYYKAILSILDLRLRYRRYDHNTSNISFSMILSTYHYTDFPLMNDTTLKYYLPELYNSAPRKRNRNLFENDSERIVALKKSIEESTEIINVLNIA